MRRPSSAAFGRINRRNSPAFEEYRGCMQSSVHRNSAFLCAVIMRARHPATRGFSARGYSFDAHGTDGRRGLGFAGLPRGLQAHPLGNNIFFCAQSQTRPREGLYRHADGAVADPSARQAYSHPRARERRRLFYMENIKYAYSRPFPLKKHRSAPTVQSQAYSLPFGGRRPAYDPPAHRGFIVTAASACPAACLRRAFRFYRR